MGFFDFPSPVLYNPLRDWVSEELQRMIQRGENSESNRHRIWWAKHGSKVPASRFLECPKPLDISQQTPMAPGRLNTPR